MYLKQVDKRLFQPEVLDIIDIFAPFLTLFRTEEYDGVVLDCP